MSKIEREEDQSDNKTMESKIASGLNIEEARKEKNEYERKIKYFQQEYGNLNLNKTEESIPNNEKNDSFDICEVTNKNKDYKKKDKKNILSILKKEENKKKKKVKFMEPMFVDIIEVESYKKFNEINTCKDPFNYIDNNPDKENVLCSCFII